MVSIHEGGGKRQPLCDGPENVPPSAQSARGRLVAGGRGGADPTPRRNRRRPAPCLATHAAQPDVVSLDADGW